MLRKGFTLVEIMVVIGILGILMGIFVFSFSPAPEKAEKAKCYDFVKQVETAIGAMLVRDGMWSKALYANNNVDEGLNEKAAYSLASSLGLKTSNGQLSGHNRFGVVTPWAEAAIKKYGMSCSLSSAVTSGGTIRDHRLRYALDADEDGIVEATVGGEAVRIRASVAVWCCGADGRIEPYTKGVRSDDVHSWTREQTVR